MRKELVKFWLMLFSYWVNTSQHQASLFLSISWSLPKLMSIALVMPSSQPSHPLDALFSFCPQSFPASGTFPMSQLFPSDDQNIGVSASTSVLPMSIQGWFPLRLVLSPCCPGDSEESSPAPQLEGINSLALCLLYCSSLITICDLWKDHSLDCSDLCWLSNVSAFLHTV